MGNYNSKTDASTDDKHVSPGTIIGIILILLLVRFGIAIIVTSKKKTGATNACDMLSPPSTITPTSTTPGIVNVSWNGVSGATSYKVYRSSSSTVTTKSYEEVKLITTETSVNFTGLTSSTQTFIVTSINSCGESIASASASIEMNCTLPAVNLTLKASTADTALATWDLVTYAMAYKVFTMVNDTESTTVVDTNVTTYAVSGSGTITVAVNAMNSCAEGAVTSQTIVI